MSDNRTINSAYEQMAHQLIKTERKLAYIYNSGVVITYLSSDKPLTAKGRPVLGQCEKVPDKYRWAIGADFTITLFEPNLEGRSEEVIRRVLYHELLHVGIKKDKDDNETYSVNPHDCEDFRDCIDKWGIDWAENS